MKKKKGSPASARRRLAVFLGIGIVFVLIILLTPLFFGNYSYDDSAIQTDWAILEVCSTDLFPAGEEINNPELMTALTDSGFIVQGISFYGITCARPRPHLDHMNITIRLDVEEPVLADYRDIGIQLHDVLSVITQTEISQQFNDSDTLNILFYVDDEWRLSWGNSIGSSFHAYNAGLTGLRLFEIGEFQ